jgi:hypothetical protein
MFDFVVFHGSLLRKDFSKQQAQLWNIPLTVSQVVQELAKGIVRLDFECQIKGLIPNPSNCDSLTIPKSVSL